MNNKYILSICIPTYNREIYLKRLINSIINQEGFSDNIEIVIDDGPSKDNTEHMIKKHQKKYPNIKYYKNEKAIGMTPAIMECVSFSQGKYTWIFSSDDVMAHNSLNHILQVIKEQEPTLIINNRLVFYKEDEYKNVNNIKINYDTFTGFNEFGDFLGKNIDKTLIEKMDYMTFMSIACFKTDHYKKSLENILKSKEISVHELKRHYFNRALIIYSNLSKHEKITLIKNINVYAQGDNCGRSKNQKIIDDLVGLFKSLSKKYKINNQGEIFFRKTINYWKFSFSILHPILNNKLIKRIKKNKTTKKIYMFFAKIIDFIIKKII